MARVYLSAAHKSSGKTTVSIGLCAALTERGKTVQPFKKGPDYIDPLWLGAASGRPCYNLDFWTQSDAEIKALAASRATGADISLIEGNKGLYDGLDVDGGNSNAALANLLETPVVLVLDTSGITRGIAPLVQGYTAFDGAPAFGGIILNKVAGPRHESKLRAVLEHYTDLPVIGAIHRNPDLEITERHLGLVPNFEHDDATAKIKAATRAVAEGVDLDAFMAIAGAAPALASALPPEKRAASVMRIGVARDAAFGFYYPDDLEALSAAGAELVFIDTMADTTLPPLDGLFIGGGFPETHMAALQANTALRHALRDAIGAGLPTYAECGGLMYLCRSLRWNGEVAEMVGVIDADAVMHDRPQGRGYARVVETANHPWGATHSAGSLPAHEFHYSGLALETMDEKPNFAYQVERGYGVDGDHDGLIVGNLLANYTHLRHTAANPWAERFVTFVAQHAARKA